ncbi:helix-turn-helix transcriptional regulator [Burkholderia sp. Ac-20365]|uniref:ArsR/SmtB family transcription factor n=1 Tax=Burkholderia sp. Ac-20365 TaxID=2703897 RepID=UPI00197B0D2C|nr:helix-turn-helix transcriptional regulator [Burkholderia sp. Ac-20365]MBN3763025.1 helix-turn-helix transcriptional regulator [Burkholderia sp. Ac-20365]
MNTKTHTTITDIDVDAIHKALANPARRVILTKLREPEKYFPTQELSYDHGVCAGQFDDCCGLSQSTVSAHLAALQRAGLITSKRVGQWVFFKRNEAVIQAFLAHMNADL